MAAGKLICLGLALLSCQADAALRHVGSAETFVRALEFKYRLRVCNAYPSASELDISRGNKESLTGAVPMPYKSCRDFSAPLQSGDKLEFKIGEATAGTFAVSDLPTNDAILLLVIHRHDPVSSSVSFESHVFANLANAQVAILDTYKGAAKPNIKLMDLRTENPKANSEELRFNSVVAVNPGLYEVELADQNGKTQSHSQFVALNQESYVVLRSGVESQQGTSFPQELIVYPQSDASELHSGSVAVSFPAAILLATLGLFVSLQ
jgi:hypothetical protein